MENEAGALSRVAGLFSARGYNIESLTVAPTEDATLSRMTIVTVGSEDHRTDHQAVEQASRRDQGDGPDRRLAYRARADAGQGKAIGLGRDEMKRTADIFRGRIIDITD